MVDPPRGLHHHVANPLRIDPGAAQHRRHYLVGEQIFEARLIAAAVIASGHDPLLTCAILRRITRKHVLFVTPRRIFSGNLYITSTKFSSKWSDRRRRRPWLSGPEDAIDWKWLCLGTYQAEEPRDRRHDRRYR